MSDLDDKLQEILFKYGMTGADPDAASEEIKQAFADDGWSKPNETN